MTPYLCIAYTCVMALLNRARGSRFWGTLQSTVAARLLATFVMSFFAAGTASGSQIQAVEIFIALWAGLMLWCTPAWDAYWSAEIGHDPAHSRLWGLWHMAIRMSLAAPCIIGLAFIAGHPWNALWAVGTPLLALPYLVFGTMDKSTAIPRSEYVAGALLGLLIHLSTK